MCVMCSSHETVMGNDILFQNDKITNFPSTLLVIVAKLRLDIKKQYQWCGQSFSLRTEEQDPAD